MTRSVSLAPRSVNICSDHEARCVPCDGAPLPRANKGLFPFRLHASAGPEGKAPGRISSIVASEGGIARRRETLRRPSHVRSLHRGLRAARLSRRPPRASRSRGCETYLRRIEALNPKLDAFVTVTAEHALTYCGAARFRRTRLATALRCPVLDQGPHVDEGNPHHVRLAELRELRPAGRRRISSGCGARAESCSARPPPRNSEAGRPQRAACARRREIHGTSSTRRRLERRRRGAGRGRARSARRGQRRRRLGAHPGLCCGVVGLKPSRGRVTLRPSRARSGAGSSPTDRSRARCATPR